MKTSVRALLLIVFATMLILPAHVSAQVEDWQIDMGITTSPNIGGVSGTLGFGAKDGASTAYSALEGDTLAPPNPASGINAYFYHSSNPSDFRKLGYSVVAPASNITWELRVQTIGGDESHMTISWDSSELPTNYTSLQLQDASGNLLRDMKTSNTYDFAVAADTTYTYKIVSVRSELHTFTTHVDPAGTGQVTLDPPGGTYNSGTFVTATASANTGYLFAGWTGDVPTGLENDTQPTLTMDSDKDITAHFLPHIVINEFMANPATGQSEWVELHNPTASPVDLTGWTIEDGASHSLGVLGGQTITANGYLLLNIAGTVLNNDGDIITLASGGAQVDKVAYGNWNDGNTADNAPTPIQGKSIGRCPNGSDTGADNIDFKVLDIPTPAAANACTTYTITASAGTNGSIDPTGTVVVVSGANQTFIITPNTGYHVADVLVDGSSVGTGSSYTFSNVTENHTITAAFAENEPEAVATRDLPNTANKTQTFDVTVSFVAPANQFNTIVVTDLAPTGWTVQANPAWCTPAATEAPAANSQAQITWNGTYLSGTPFTAMYKVTVPAGIPSQTYPFSGTLAYKIGSSGILSVAIAGDSEINVQDGGCFIATAAYGSYMDKDVTTLRQFRDKYLESNPPGRVAVDVYYKVSPPVAHFIDDHPTLKPVVRAALLPAVAVGTVAVHTNPVEKVLILTVLLMATVLGGTWIRRRLIR